MRLTGNSTKRLLLAAVAAGLALGLAGAASATPPVTIVETYTSEGVNPCTGNPVTISTTSTDTYRFTGRQAVVTSVIEVADSDGYVGSGHAAGTSRYDEQTLDLTANLIVRAADGSAVHVQQKGTIDLLTFETTFKIFDTTCIRG